MAASAAGAGWGTKLGLDSKCKSDKSWMFTGQIVADAGLAP